MSKIFLLFDGRAKAGLIDDAVVMDTARTEEEARREGETSWEGHDAIWAETDDEDTEPVLRWDLPPARMGSLRCRPARIKTATTKARAKSS